MASCAIGSRKAHKGWLASVTGASNHCHRIHGHSPRARLLSDRFICDQEGTVVLV